MSKKHKRHGRQGGNAYLDSARDEMEASIERDRFDDYREWKAGLDSRLDSQEWKSGEDRQVVSYRGKQREIDWSGSKGGSVTTYNAGNAGSNYKAGSGLSKEHYHDGTAEDRVTILDGVSIYGAQYKELHVENFGLEKTLLVNCYGTPFSAANRKIVESRWSDLNDHAARFDEIIIHWADMKAPALAASFWVRLWEIVKEEEFERVVACCLGGHGRTGTTLAAMMIVNGYTAKEAMKFIREVYCKRAIETDSQEKYLKAIAEVIKAPRATPAEVVVATNIKPIKIKDEPRVQAVSAWAPEAANGEPVEAVSHAKPAPLSRWLARAGVEDKRKYSEFLSKKAKGQVRSPGGQFRKQTPKENFDSAV